MQSSSTRIGMIILLVLIAAAAYVAVDRPLDTLRENERGPSPAKVAAASPRVVAAVPAPAAPVTPVYKTRAEPSPSAPIYRCRSGSRTIYTQEPCDDGRIVVTSSAVDGYDTKPSDRLERLVADGRTAEVPQTSIVPIRTPSTRATSFDCANYAQQIADLDAEALALNSARAQDRIRRIREDVRTSMARLRC